MPHNYENEIDMTQHPEKENFHSFCENCKSLIPNKHFDCIRAEVVSTREEATEEDEKNEKFIDFEKLEEQVHELRKGIREGIIAAHEEGRKEATALARREEREKNEKWANAHVQFVADVLDGEKPEDAYRTLLAKTDLSDKIK